jgi:hypothetical protein
MTVGVPVRLRDASTMDVREYLSKLTQKQRSRLRRNSGGFSDEVQQPDGQKWEQLWLEDRIDALLDQHDEGVLFISGCVSNQRTFYPRFDAVVGLERSQPSRLP